MLSDIQVMWKELDFQRYPDRGIIHGTLGAIERPFCGRLGANVRGFRGVFFIYPDYLMSNLTRRFSAVDLWKTDPTAPLHAAEKGPKL